MTIQELINSHNIKALLAAFFNLTDDNDSEFIITSEYRPSTYSQNKLSDYDYLTINQGLKSYFGLNFTSTRAGKHTVSLQKTDEINTTEQFFAEIYRQIQLLSFEVETKEYEEYVIMSLFALRGSADFSMQYYSVDIYRKYSNKDYIRSIFQILSGINAISQLNLNFREFQPQYTSGTHRRNTQIRVKLGWFWFTFKAQLEQINEYKYSILSENTKIISDSTASIGNFSDRLVEYLNNVLGEEIDKKVVNNERHRLGLDSSNMALRDYNLKTIANKILPDECMGCKNRFDKRYRTFKLREQEKHYFELHHIIPFSKGKEHDQIDNLAKLCAVCHRVLTKNRASEVLQKLTITEILNNSTNAQKYVSVLAGDSNLQALVNFVYMKLV